MHFSVQHKLLQQRPQWKERCVSSMTSASYERCGTLDSPEEEIWSNNGNYPQHPALATSDTQDNIQAVPACIQESTWLCSYLSVGTYCASFHQEVSTTAMEWMLDVAVELIRYGNCNCSVSEPTAWNKHPSDICHPSISLDRFCSRI